MTSTEDSTSQTKVKSYQYNPWGQLGLSSEDSAKAKSSSQQIVPCKGMITKVSNLGLVTMEFNYEVFLTDEFSNKTVDIKIVPTDPSD